MSRLFPERLLIGLAPDSVSMLRVSGGAKPRALDKRTLACEPGSGEPWEGAATALSRLAAEIGKASARVTVVLSNHFARYALVPWSKALGKADEEAAFARYCFARVHGERSKDWDLRLSPGASGSARIASAVDAPLVQAVRSAFSGGAKLASLQPYLMSAFNRARAQLAGASAWFLLVEPGRTCVAHLERGSLTAVRNVRGGRLETPDLWTGLLDRERHLAGGDAEEVHVHAPGSGWDAFPAQVGGWTFKKLPSASAEGLGTAESAPYALALSAL